MKTLKEIDPGPATLKIAADEVTKKYADYIREVSDYVQTDTDINASDIETDLIRYAARYCDRYAGDILYIINALEPFLSAPADEPGRWIIGAGFYEDGVDSNRAILYKLRESKRYNGIYQDFVHPEHYYRRIAVIDIQDKIGDYGIERTIALKDVTHHLLRLAPEDEETDD